MRPCGSASTARSWRPARIPGPTLAIPAGAPSAPWGVPPSWHPTSPAGVGGQELEPRPRRITRLTPKWCPVPMPAPLLGIPAGARDRAGWTKVSMLGEATWADLACVPPHSCACLRRWSVGALAQNRSRRRSATHMRLHRLRQAPTRDQLQEMLEAQGSFIKLAVAVRQGILAGGGEYHADCE